MLRIGKINFVNLYPIFFCLEARARADNRQYLFIKGVPSEINAMLREGKLDVSPSSSIEYLRHPEMYSVIEEHSVSAQGPILSTLLFSKEKIEELDGKTVIASYQSETSTALLKIILAKFYGISATVRVSRLPLDSGLKEYPAYMLIGDDALTGAQRFGPDSGFMNEDTSAALDEEKQAGPHEHIPYIYDLGRIWYERTGLPFVFALWIARKDLCKEEILSRFKEDLDRAREEALQRLGEISLTVPHRDIFSQETLISYWESISYNLSDKHMEGLALFQRYLKDLKLL